MKNKSVTVKKIIFRDVVKIIVLIISAKLFYLGSNKLIHYQDDKFTKASENIEQLRESIYISAGGIKEYHEYLSQARSSDTYQKIIRDFDPTYINDIVSIGEKFYQMEACQVKAVPIKATDGRDGSGADTTKFGFKRCNYNVLVNCIVDQEANFFRFINYLSFAVPGVVIVTQFYVKQYDKIANNANNSRLDNNYNGPVKVELLFDWYFLMTQ
jgi:hypothetical protein